jgi:hypothetical protein
MKNNGLWYALDVEGVFYCLGKCSNFDDADEKAGYGTIWIWSPAEVTEMLKVILGE